ncbi:MAG: PEP-CTERM sorting domain-containing protein [Tepidisphaeraceae bacterium]
MKHYALIAAAALSAAIATVAGAVPIVDGTKDGEYGSALAVQTVETGFGDNASEWNAGYGRIDSGKLYLILTGNLENNFNKLEIFIDSKAGGQSVFDSSGNDGANVMDGLLFDAGFTADYHLIARRGSSVFDLDYADLTAQTASNYGNVFGGTDFGSGTTGTGVNTLPIALGYNGSNTAGVLGGGSAAANQAAAQAVTTGFEIGIDLVDLGWTGGPINVMVGQNGSGHNYWSNQFLAGLPAPQGNLGGDEAGGFTGEGAINMNNFGGNQYFAVVVPEPASIGLLAAGALALVRRRRAR